MEALTHYSLDEPRKHPGKWKKPDTKGHILYALCEMFRQANPRRQREDWWLAGAMGMGRGSDCWCVWGLPTVPTDTALGGWWCGPRRHIRSQHQRRLEGEGVSDCCVQWLELYPASSQPWKSAAPEWDSSWLRAVSWPDLFLQESKQTAPRPSYLAGWVTQADMDSSHPADGWQTVRSLEGHLKIMPKPLPGLGQGPGLGAFSKSLGPNSAILWALALPTWQTCSPSSSPSSK